MLVGDDLLDAARRARETGVVGGLEPGPGVLVVAGADAARFLHNQLTNEVGALAPGEGNLTARVERSGHLLHLLHLARLSEDVDGAAAFVILTEPGGVPGLVELFEAYVFSEQVRFSDRTGEWSWLVAQGPEAGPVLGSVLGVDLAVEGPCRSEIDGAVLVRHRLLGDEGLLLGLPVADPGAEGTRAEILAAAETSGLETLAGADLLAVLDVLRVEAGVVLVGPDLGERRRLLPETGLENQAVSYTKGCYLGQEVIARVRTYGSLPFELRGLVVAAVDDGEALPGRMLEVLPERGGDLELEDGTVVGQVASRAVSPVMDAAVALAFVDRNHRLPGGTLRVRGREGSLVNTTVTLLPFYRAGDRASRAEAIYNQAISVFAAGREEQALRLLERVLEIDPSFEDGYEAVGLILGRAGRFEEAISIFRRLEELAPEVSLVNTNLSLYYMKIGDKATAEEHAARALRKSAGGSVAGSVSRSEEEARERELRRAEAERKRAMFSQVLEIDPDDPIALFGLGNALAALERWVEAEELFARAITAQRTNAAIYLARGRALEKLDRQGEAVEVYEAGMEVASKRGDLAPLREMQTRVMLLRG